MPSGPDTEALKALVAYSQGWADWSTIVVFVGLLLEIVIIFAYRKDRSPSETILSLICALIIALGVYGEYRFGSRAARGNAQLQQIFDFKVASLGAEAETAKELAESERLARIELESQLAPRTLTPNQQARIAAKLGKFAGERADIGCFPDSESRDFGEQVTLALRSARWDPNPSIAPAGVNGMPIISGLMIMTGLNNRSEEVGSLLGNALRKEGVQVVVEPLTKFFPNFTFGDRRSTDSYAARVLIVVGNHPPPHRSVVTTSVK